MFEKTYFHVLMLQQQKLQKISSKQIYPLKHTKHVDGEEESDNGRQRKSLTAALKRRTDADECVCVQGLFINKLQQDGRKTQKKLHFHQLQLRQKTQNTKSSL